RARRACFVIDASAPPERSTLSLHDALPIYRRRWMMDAFANLLMGFQIALSPYNLMIATAGIVLGTIIGVLPGLGGANGVAILLRSEERRVGKEGRSRWWRVH